MLAKVGFFVIRIFTSVSGISNEVCSLVKLMFYLALVEMKV